MNSSASSTEHHTLIGLLCVVTAALTFSVKAVIIKLTYGYGAQVTPINLLTLRMAMSLPFFLAALLILKPSQHRAPLEGKDHLRLITLGVIGFYLAAYLDFVGLSYISASLERLVLMLYPTLVILLSALIFRRAVTLKEIIALFLSYAGIVIVFAEEFSIVGSDVMLGTALIFSSALAYASYLIGSGVMVKQIGTMYFTAYAMTIASITTLLHFCLDFDAAILDLPHEIYGLAFVIAVVSTVIPTFLMNAGIKRIGANSASIISSLGPVMTLLLAYLFLNEELTFVQLMGALLVMIGVVVISVKR